MTHFVYYLADDTGTVVYVGRSTRPRERLLAARNRYGEQLEIKKLSKPMTLEDACELERKELCKLRPKFNRRVSSSPGNFGMKLGRTPEHRAKLIETHVGMLGKKHTEESKARIAAGGLGRTPTEETRVKLKAWTRKKGWKHSEETLKKLSAVHKGVPKSAEHRAKISAANKGKCVAGHPHTPESIERIRVAVTESWERRKNVT
jgi:NUMOD3 motif